MAGEPLLQFFTYAHLKGELAAVSQPFCDLANRLVQTLPRNPERTTALRKLLEAKDCAVRAVLWKDDDRPAATSLPSSGEVRKEI